MSKPTGKLLITVNSCKDLPNKEFIGRMDIYCKVYIGEGEKFKTKVDKGGHTNPTFNHSFVFNLNGHEDLFHVVVYDEELIGSDKGIGRMDLDITKLVVDNKPHYYDLYNLNNFRKVAGQISLTCRFEGNNWPNQPNTSTTATTTVKQQEQPQQQYHQPQPQQQPVMMMNQQPAPAYAAIQQPQLQQQPMMMMTQPAMVQVRPQMMTQPQVVIAQPQPVMYAQPQPMMQMQPQVVYQQPMQPQIVYQQQATAPSFVYQQPRYQ